MKAALGDVITSYSHGMRQKLSLIAALLHDPEILVLDEPIVGLDPRAAFTLKETMKKLCTAGKTVFFSTHIMEVAERLCDRVGIISRGELVAAAPLEELRARAGEKDATLEKLFLEMTDENARARGGDPSGHHVDFQPVGCASLAARTGSGFSPSRGWASSSGLAVVEFMLVGVYRSLLAAGQATGHPEMVIFYGLLASWAFLFVTAIPLALSVLYYSSDLKLLLTLPLRPLSIMGAKGLLLYLYCLPVNFALFVPRSGSMPLPRECRLR